MEPLIYTAMVREGGAARSRGPESGPNERDKIIPDNWTKVYYEWMNNIRDWCISRQIWWGHRIPHGPARTADRS